MNIVRKWSVLDAQAKQVQTYHLVVMSDESNRYSLVRQVTTEKGKKVATTVLVPVGRPNERVMQFAEDHLAYLETCSCVVLELAVKMS